jgi:hypothetical protein
MANLDRAGMIDLLSRLGDASDETALAAARELNRQVGESGRTWDDLLRANLDATADVDIEKPVDEPVETVADGDEPVGGKAEVARLIDRLLARKTLSDTLRDDLTEIKGNIADGTFDDMDAKYVRALAKRLGV